MTDLPRRLVVIEAAIPTGDSCSGCMYASYQFKSRRIAGDIARQYVAICTDSSIGGGVTHGLRSDACKARDAYRVDAMAAALIELSDADQPLPMSAPLNQVRAHAQRLNNAIATCHRLAEQIRAARLVANEVEQ